MAHNNPPYYSAAHTDRNSTGPGHRTTSQSDEVSTANPSSRDEDVRDRKLPGGSLLSAYLDRQLMIWSDRGGASRHIGDRWAARCTEWLESLTGTDWQLPDGEVIKVAHVLRLDDVEAVSREANLNHLENPDFLLIGFRESAPQTAIVLALDAKFAADRIKPSQVSAQVVENLLTIPETGVTRELLDSELEEGGFTSKTIIDGAFLCPDSTLTDFLLSRQSRSRGGREPQATIVLVTPATATMFADLPASRLISILARQDQLPVSPRDNLLSALYYFRVASACLFLWQEQHMPLFSVDTDAQPEIGLVSADVTLRAATGISSYDLMMDMVDEAEAVQRARQSVANVAALPLRMAEIRSMVQQSARDNEKILLRTLRKDLELEFRRKLYEQVGEIPSDDPRPIGQILDQVAAASRDLRQHMHEFAVERLKELTPALSVS